MVAVQSKIKAVKKLPPKISWATFQKKYLSREDKFKYEWVNGRVEKTMRTMDKKQIFILVNLLPLLHKLRLKGKVNGWLLSEVDTKFAGNHRRPDISYYTDEEVKKAIEDDSIFPNFVIEVISSNDQINNVHKKMEDYHNAGVEIIWHIFPKLNQVHVYTNKGLSMKVLKGKQLCSAEPVIDGFKISVKELLKKD